MKTTYVNLKISSNNIYEIYLLNIFIVTLTQVSGVNVSGMAVFDVKYCCVGSVCVLNVIFKLIQIDEYVWLALDDSWLDAFWRRWWSGIFKWPFLATLHWRFIIKVVHLELAR